MSLLAVVAVVLGLAGGSAAATGTAAPVKACTEIGCSSALQVDFGGLPLAHPNVSRVRICIQDQCRTLKRKSMKYAFRAIRGPMKGGTHKVTYVARGRNGKVLARGSTRATDYMRNQPNGPGCPPICFEFGVRFFADGRFEEIPVIVD